MTELFNEHSLLSIEDWKENLSVSFELTQLDYLAVVAFNDEEIKLIYHLEVNDSSPDYQDPNFKSLFRKQEKNYLRKQHLFCKSERPIFSNILVFSFSFV